RARPGPANRPGGWAPDAAPTRGRRDHCRGPHPPIALRRVLSVPRGHRALACRGRAPRPAQPGPRHPATAVARPKRPGGEGGNFRPAARSNPPDTPIPVLEDTMRTSTKQLIALIL